MKWVKTTLILEMEECHSVIEMHKDVTWVADALAMQESP